MFGRSGYIVHGRLEPFHIQTNVEVRVDDADLWALFLVVDLNGVATYRGATGWKVDEFFRLVRGVDALFVGIVTRHEEAAVRIDDRQIEVVLIGPTQQHLNGAGAQALVGATLRRLETVSVAFALLAGLDDTVAAARQRRRA